MYPLLVPGQAIGASVATRRGGGCTSVACIPVHTQVPVMPVAVVAAVVAALSIVGLLSLTWGACPPCGFCQLPFAGWDLMSWLIVSVDLMLAGLSIVVENQYLHLKFLMSIHVISVFPLLGRTLMFSGRWSLWSPNVPHKWDDR